MPAKVTEPHVSTFRNVGKKNLLRSSDITEQFWLIWVEQESYQRTCECQALRDLSKVRQHGEKIPDERGWRHSEKIFAHKYVTQKKCNIDPRFTTFTLHACKNIHQASHSVFYKQIRLDRLLFSVEDCSSVYVSRISFWNRFGERRFTILWVILWQPHQIFSNHVARAGYVLSPLFSPPCCWYDWFTQDRGCFQRLKLVRFLGYDPGRQSLPTADCLAAFLWSSDDIALPTTCKAKGEL